MMYLFKVILRLLFVIVLIAYSLSGLIIIVPAIIYILGINDKDPFGCTIDFFDNLYWKINNS